MLDEAGEVISEQNLGTTPKAMKEFFATMPRSRIALETGMHSPWVSRWRKTLPRNRDGRRSLLTTTDLLAEGHYTQEPRLRSMSDMGDVTTMNKPIPKAGGDSR
jgi:hypothetical protein